MDKEYDSDENEGNNLKYYHSNHLVSHRLRNKIFLSIEEKQNLLNDFDNSLVNIDSCMCMLGQVEVINLHNLYDWVKDNYLIMDDSTYDGGVLVLKIEPIFDVIEKLRLHNSKVVYIDLLIMNIAKYFARSIIIY